MIYIEMEENKKIDVKKSFFKNLFFKISNKLNSKSSKIIEEKIEDKTLLKLPNIENKTLNKLSKYIKKNCICKVCLSNNLLENPVFMEYIKNQKVKLFDGKWLFKMLAINTIDYVIENKKEKKENQEISILSNKIDDITVFVIRNLAEDVKIINILTNNSYKFRKIEKELYEEKGIIINMNNNYKKSLVKSDMILNFDFSEEELNKYTIPKKTCIINFNDYANINTKSFDGINIGFYEISMPKKYFKYLLHFKNFNTSILYESFIYKNTNPANIIKEIQNDNSGIVFLYRKKRKNKKK